MSIPIGLLAGLLLAGLVSYLDRRLKREEQVEALTQLPVVASIPRRSERLVRRRAGGGVWADPVEAESYGRLATNLRFFNFDRQVKTVLVTSAIPEEGKTTVTLRLAAALAGAGQGVLAIEADLRRPTFTDYFSIQFPHGLSGVLIGATPFEDVVTRVHTSYALAAPTEEGDEAWTTAPFIEVVPAGVIPPNPTELLAGQRAAAGAARGEVARRHRARRLRAARAGRRRDPDRQRGRRRAARGQAGREPARRAAQGAEAARHAAVEGDRRRDHERGAPVRQVRLLRDRAARPGADDGPARARAAAAAGPRRGSRTAPRRTARARDRATERRRARRYSIRPGAARSRPRASGCPPGSGR